MARKIGILRLSHRIFRDKRITTHLALTARAFGCEEFAYTGVKDKNFENSIMKTVSRFGGNFTLVHIQGFSSYVKNWSGLVIHLTMFGESYKKTIKSIEQSEEDILLVVGGMKVPPVIYQLADYNTAIGHQPHSEISATAVFLTQLNQSVIEHQEFKNAKYKIKPEAKSRGLQKN